MSWINKLKDKLNKTRLNFVGKIYNFFKSKERIDANFWEELEEILINSDIGVFTANILINKLKHIVKIEKINQPSLLIENLKEEMFIILKESASPLNLNLDFNIILIVGVNGAGKTTSIAKLTRYLKEKDKKVLLAAADTFRAAAIDQLEIWAKRLNVDIIKHHSGADPAAVVHDAIKAAHARKADILIIDTAGRLQNKVNLMEELRKIKKVITKEAKNLNPEVLLVLDANTGQNAFQQAKIFKEIVEISGIILAKLDGTAKGGIIFGIASELKIPVKFIGIGESLEDLKEFNPQDFIEAIFE
ncbi:MAG: signal recognition particle-docking protein FtsY [Armatimonadetes bacterium]|nr:signal recognition particle-docking protein FtsY [Armatimonadota bacterium]